MSKELENKIFKIERMLTSLTYDIEDLDEKLSELEQDLYRLRRQK